MPSCLYLTAEHADTADGDAVLELSASIPANAPASTRAAVRAEVQQVLTWCEARCPGDHGPRDEGHAWHHDLLAVDEADGWHTVSLTITADADFIAALGAACFPPDEA